MQRCSAVFVGADGEVITDCEDEEEKAEGSAVQDVLGGGLRTVIGTVKASGVQQFRAVV